jgi:hypothetical protein
MENNVFFDKWLKAIARRCRDIYDEGLPDVVKLEDFSQVESLIDDLSYVPGTKVAAIEQAEKAQEAGFTVFRKFDLCRHDNDATEEIYDLDEQGEIRIIMVVCD